MFGALKMFLLSYWRGNISVSDILSVFSLEIHVFTHHSPKSQFMWLITRTPRMAKLWNAGKPNSYFITVTWSLVFTCNFSGTKLVSVVDCNYSHSLELACNLKQVLGCLDQLILLGENIVTVNAANISLC